MQFYTISIIDANVNINCSHQKLFFVNYFCNFYHYLIANILT